MSEKLDHVVGQLHEHLQQVEQKLDQAKKAAADESPELADATHRRIDRVQARVDLIRDEAVARADEIRKQHSTSEADAKPEVEKHVHHLRERLKDQLTELQKSWGDVLTDISGGSLF